MQPFEFLTAFVSILMLLMWAIGAAGVLAGRSTRIRFRTERLSMAWC